MGRNPIWNYQRRPEKLRYYTTERHANGDAFDIVL